jgi:Cytochrome P450
MLAEHPDIEGRLREEIYEKVGETGRPTYDQIREMKYMRAFLNGMYPHCVLAKTLLLKILCGRGPKAVSPGVSFSLR